MSEDFDRNIIQNNFNEIERLNRKLLALEKTTALRPEKDNLRKKGVGHFGLLQQQTIYTNPEKTPPVSKTPPVTPSGVNGLSPEKKKKDLRNGIIWEVLKEYG